MPGKPLPAARLAAELYPPVLRVPYFDEDAAVAAVKGTLHGAGMYVLRMFPVQAFAAGRTELRPLISFVRYDDDGAAMRTAEFPHRLFPAIRPVMIDKAIAMGVAAAKGAAILLRDPALRKQGAADRAFRSFLHVKASLTPSWHRPDEHRRKKDSISLCCLKRVSYIEGHTKPRIVVISRMCEQNKRLLYPPPRI